MTLALLPAVAFAARSYKITFHVEGEGYVYARNYGTNLTEGSFVMVEEGQHVILYAMANSKDYKMKTATAEGATLTWGGSATRTLKTPTIPICCPSALSRRPRARNLPAGASRLRVLLSPTRLWA